MRTFSLHLPGGDAVHLRIALELRLDHADALKQIREYGILVDSGEKALDTIDGWPALTIQKRVTPPRADNAPAGPAGEQLWIRTIIAVENKLVTANASVPVHLADGVVRQVLEIMKSLDFNDKADPDKVGSELKELKKQSSEKKGNGVPGAASVQLRLRTPAVAEGLVSDGANARIDTSGDGELEIAADVSGRHIIVALQSRRWVSSNDGGSTFPHSGTVGAGNGDPSVAWGQSGKFYMAFIHTECHGSGIYQSGVPVPDLDGNPGPDPIPNGLVCTGMARSDDKGATFSSAVVNPAVVCKEESDPVLTGACFPDQEHIAADRVNPGATAGDDQVYSAWRNFTQDGENAALVCSSDSGRTWTNQTNAGTAEITAVGVYEFFPRLTVGPDGHVYVATFDGLGFFRLYKFTSCVNGLSQVAGWPVNVAARDPFQCPFAGHDRCDQNPTSQTVVVDTGDQDHVYYAYVDDSGNGDSGESNVIVRDSLDGGLTWPANREVQANAAVSGRRIMPWLCTTAGDAIVTWYEQTGSPVTDSTDFAGGLVGLDDAGDLIAKQAFQISEVSDRWCDIGWPCLTRWGDTDTQEDNSAEACPVQPQLAGVCGDGDEPNTTPDSGNLCDFSEDDGTTFTNCLPAATSPSGNDERCLQGGGCPKYGDYNGNACVGGKLFAAWASAKAPPALPPPDTASNPGVLFDVIELKVDAPIIDLPAEVQFGNVCGGGVTSQAMFRICNVGGGDLDISSIVSDDPDFSIVDPPSGYPATVTPGSCLFVQIDFSSTTSGARAAQVTVSSNDVERSTAVVPASVTDTTGTDCTSCVPGATIQSMLGGRIRWPRVVLAGTAHGGAKGPGSAGALLTGITVTLGADGVLRIVGTSGNDQIEIRQSTGDPSLIEIEDLATSDTFSFNLSDVAAVEAAGGDGNDLIVLNDPNDVLGTPSRPLSVDGGIADDTIIGTTGTHTLQEVLDYLALLQTADGIRTSADQVFNQAGAAAPVGGGTGDVISKSVGLFTLAHDDLLVPGKTIVGDVPSTLIGPAADLVEGVRTGPVAGGLQLMADAYNGPVLESFCTIGGVCSPSATPQLFNSSRRFALIESAQALASQADALAMTAQARADGCRRIIEGEGRAQFEAILNQGKDEILGIAETCGEGPEDELPEPDPDIFSSRCAPLSCDRRWPMYRTRDAVEGSSVPEGPGMTSAASLSDCHVEMEQIIECLDQDVAAFEKRAELCVAAGDEVNGLAEALPDLEPAADLLAAQAETLAANADTFAASAEAYALQWETYVVGAGNDLETAGAGLDQRVQDDLIMVGESFAAQQEAAFETDLSALETMAQDLVSQAEALIAQTLDQIEGGPSFQVASVAECADIVTNTTFTGSAGNDVLLGSAQNDRIEGGDGADLIAGVGGDDRLLGQNGWDLVFGGSGVNEGRGGEGLDLLIGGNEKDCLFGEDSKDVVFGRGGADELDGGDDVDLIVGGSGNDLAHGRQGIDIVFTQGGDDEAWGEECIDLLVTGADADTAYGGTGQTLTLGTLSLEMGDVLLGGPGADIQYGDAGASQGRGLDVMFGGADADRMFGAHGGDFTVGTFTLVLGNVMFGGTGPDEMNGKDGIDFMFGGGDNDTLSAGKGDLITFADGVTLDMGDFLFGGDGDDQMDGDDSGEPNGIDLMFGGADNDVMRGYNGGTLTVDGFDLTFGNLMSGGSGNDVLISRDGIDLILGGSEHDNLSAGNGDTIEVPNKPFRLEFGDLLFGQTGDDFLYGDDIADSDPSLNDGIDLMFAGDGADELYSGNGGVFEPVQNVTVLFGNLMFGSLGNDTLVAGYRSGSALSDVGEPGIDLVFGGAGNDVMNGGNGGDIQIGSFPSQFEVNFGNLMFGSTENDTLKSGDGFDLMFGGAGSEVAITAGEGIDLIFGGPGDDRNIDGGNGGTVTIPISGVSVPIPFGNLIFGGGGEDEMRSGGCDTVTLEKPLCFLEIDLLFGNDCDDTISSGGGLLDLVFGNRGNDTIDGDAPGSPDGLIAINVLFGNRQNDTIHGGSGVANIAFGNRGDDVVFGGNALLDLVFGNDGIDIIEGGGAIIDVLFGNANDDRIAAGSGAVNVAFGNSGWDTISADGVFDLAFGNSGNDILTGGSGLDVFFGNSENDTLSGNGFFDLLFGNSGYDTVSGGGGFDLAFGNDNDDVVMGGDDPDLLFGNGGNDQIIGGSGITLGFGNSGTDVLFGDSSTDILFGNGEGDWLYGGNGADLLFGNGEADTLRGGGGAGLSFGNAGNDIIIGSDGVDLIFGNRDDDRILAGDSGDLSFGNRGADHLDGNIINNKDDNRDFSFGNFGPDTLYRCNDPKDFLFGGFGNNTKTNDCINIGATDAAAATIQGRKMSDHDCDGTGDAGLPNTTIYLDADQDGVLDAGELSTLTDEKGYYVFRNLAAGFYVVREMVPCGYVRLIPPNAHFITLAYNQTSPSLDFINCDLCRPDPTGATCLPCAFDVSPVVELQCSNDGSECQTDSDCACGGTCVSRVVECEAICEPCSTNHDIDRDTVNDGVDNCPTLYNPSQGSSGTRGLFCDAASDHDGDMIAEGVDNCPNEGGSLEFGVPAPPLASTYNPDQRDSDCDGIGDMCDPCPDPPVGDPNGFGAPIPARCPAMAGAPPGTLCEGFDDERNGVPGLQWSRLPVAVSAVDPLRAVGDPNDDVLGYTIDAGASPLGTASVTCSDDVGMHVGCAAPVAQENDWHLHSPYEGPGAGYDPSGGAGIGAPDGGKAHVGLRSMHMGRHLSPTSTLMDTIRLRQVSAFVLDSQADPNVPGIVLGPTSTLEFWHMISVPDDENFGNGFIPVDRSFGGGQVQISVLDPNGRLENWRTLIPNYNGYDSAIQESVNVCGFDPGDDQGPGGETLCNASPLWADMGDVFGMDTTCTTDTDGNDAIHKDCGAVTCTPGPGCTEAGSTGSGVWTRSGFDLSSYSGRVARLRWIGMVEGGWSFGTARSALEPEPGSVAYNYYDGDDGWWIDDIKITDVRGPVGCFPDN